MREVDKIGNDKADGYADEGMQLFGKEVVQLGVILTSRHLQYSQFIKMIHDRILDVFRTKQEML